MPSRGMTSLGRSLVIAVALTALVALARPTGAMAAPRDTPRVGQASPATPAGTAARRSAVGTVFWANAGVERLAHPGSPAHRARLLVRLMRGAGATIGLLAETTGRQARDLRRAAGKAYGVVAARPRGETNAVVYATRAYEVERTVAFRTYSYRGRLVPARVVVLRDRTSGARIAVLAVHHPASNTRRGTQARWQRASWRRELGALRRVGAAYGGRISTFLGGDFNQRGTCRLVARTGLVSPVGTVSSCPTARTRIDQLFADRGVRFDDYRTIRRGAARKATDHAGVYASAFGLSQPA